MSIHNDELNKKLTQIPIVGHLNGEEKRIFANIKMNMVLSKNIPMTLKTKRYDSVININQGYNIWHINNKEKKGSKNWNEIFFEIVG